MRNCIFWRCSSQLAGVSGLAQVGQGGTAFVWWATWLKTARGQNVLTIRIFEQARKRIETANEAVE
jgi:hypothetical protein